MARIFLTNEEAVEWGLQKPKYINFGKMKEKVLIRVLAGVIVFLLLVLLQYGGSPMTSLLTSVQAAILH